MKDENFLKENNARHLWHPMGHPRDNQENPPKIITKAEGVKITDIDGHTTMKSMMATSGTTVFSEMKSISMTRCRPRSSMPTMFWLTIH